MPASSRRTTRSTARISRSRRASPEARAKHARDVAEERQKEHDTIEEIFRVYEMRIVGREDLRGYQTIVGTLEPRPSYKPRTDDGQVMKRFRARVWINEADYQLARVDLEAIDDVTYRVGHPRPPAQRGEGHLREKEGQRRGLAPCATPNHRHGPVRVVPDLRDRLNDRMVGIQKVWRQNG